MNQIKSFPFSFFNQWNGMELIGCPAALSFLKEKCGRGSWLWVFADGQLISIPLPLIDLLVSE